jgi:stage III sporulation protein AA
LTLRDYFLAERVKLLPGGLKQPEEAERWTPTNRDEAGWESIAHWFGRALGPVIGRVRVIPFQEAEEIRLRIKQPLLLQTTRRDHFLDEKSASVSWQQAYAVTSADLQEALERMTYSSIYAAEQELRQGFLTLPGGHRVGVTGETVWQNQQVQTLKNISALNFRIAHEVRDIGLTILPYLLGADHGMKHTLLLSAPRAGKTTMIRDLVRLLSDGVPGLRLAGQTVGVVDERGELAGMRQGEPSYNLGMRTDILDACPKSQGMAMLVRSMAPQVIVTDELGSPADVEAIADAMRTGVKILSTAHAHSFEEALGRPILKLLIGQGVFERIVILSRRKGPGTVEKIFDPRDGREFFNARGKGRSED